MGLSASLAFGYHNSQSVAPLVTDDKDNKPCARFINVMHAISYIPIIGVISGLFHISLGIIHLRDGNHALGTAFLLRGIVEVVTLGFANLVLFAIADVVVSLKRDYSDHAGAPTAPGGDADGVSEAVDDGATA